MNPIKSPPAQIGIFFTNMYMAKKDCPHAHTLKSNVNPPIPLQCMETISRGSHSGMDFEAVQD